ncbi:MAG: formylglycine-generating enzyme family protein [Gemmatimonadetes bacterium]|nr:formylglycine-generating enzyme family protein [Gemmatimonadota bacterium]
MEFVWIEPGVFQMGSERGRSDESPVHEVEISRGFWLGKFEVTQEQWKSVMDEEPWAGWAIVESNPLHPAVIISWDEVQEFIRRINEDAGEGLYRLPTEAEWEYACRAGTQTRWSFGDDESLLPEYAWYYGNNYFTEGAKEVGGKLPNPWGLYDMHGNVWEWVQDWYDEDYYSSSVRNDPQGPTSGLGRVIRGGHFGHIDGVRSAYRHLRFLDSRSYTVGVRLLKIAGD